jgi:drug/metabolite transporter (DMT)-like permease
LLASELLAISASVCLALSGMLVTELKGRVDIFRLARWNMLAALGMTGAVSLALGGWRTLTPSLTGLLALSSLFGIVIATTAYYATLYAAGPRATSLMFSLTAPIALGLGYVGLGETIGLRQAGGVALVLVGIVLAIGLPAHGAASDQGPSRIAWAGIGLGVLTAFGQALGSLLARPAMAAGVEPFTAMAVRIGIGAAFFVGLSALPLAPLRRPYRFSKADLIIAVAAAFIGTGLGMALLMAALAKGEVGLVSSLSSMTPIVILPMIWIRTGIAPPARGWIGAALAVAGVGLISVR